MLCVFMGSKAGHQERQIVVRVDHVGGRNGVTGRAQQQMTPPPPPTQQQESSAAT